MSKKVLFLIVYISFCISSYAARVDTVTIFSNAMQKNIKCVVIKPAGKKNKTKAWPVVYLLHGYSW